MLLITLWNFSPGEARHGRASRTRTRFWAVGTEHGSGGGTRVQGVCVWQASRRESSSGCWWIVSMVSLTIPQNCLSKVTTAACSKTACKNTFPTADVLLGLSPASLYVSNGAGGDDGQRQSQGLPCHVLCPRGKRGMNLGLEMFSRGQTDKTPLLGISGHAWLVSKETLWFQIHIPHPQRKGP